MLGFIVAMQQARLKSGCVTPAPVLSTSSSPGRTPTAMRQSISNYATSNSISLPAPHVSTRGI